MRTALIGLLIGLAVLLGGCLGGPPAPGRSFTLVTQNDSGVSGTVTLTGIEDDRTAVEIDVDPAGHPDMPAHIHSGSCEEMVPQPMFPLESVRDGSSRTEVPIALDELLADTVTLNLHHSNDQMQISVACIDLGPA
jgi:hypothetical protein